MNGTESILVSGASGFVGSALSNMLCTNTRFKVSSLLRQASTVLHSGVERLYFKDFESLDSCISTQPFDVVIHCAARVHVMSEDSQDPLSEFRRVNVDGTMALAKFAVKSGVKRFIYLSSIKVNGESTSPQAPFQASDLQIPQDPYGLSKYEAEDALLRLSAETGMEVVIIRPPLVYGPGVKANFYSMMRWLSKGIPLPFGSIRNLRSMVALDNLIDLIITCIDHPAAANQVFLVSDGEDLSTTTLLKKMALALGMPIRLIPIPSWLLSIFFIAIGRKSMSQRLCGYLQVDISKTRDLLGWTPPVSVDNALLKTANHFLGNTNK